MNKFGKFFKSVLVILVSLILFVTLRGSLGNPTAKDLLKLNWRDNGPFELSPERGRFTLLFSIIEDHSFYYSLDLARFVIPDLGYKDGHYVSLFAPAVSYIIMPGYLIGKFLNASQVGTYAIISIFALINTYLIKKISQKLGASETASILAGLLFLFATPAFAYAVDLYQHHISTFLILMSVYSLISWNNFWSNALIYFLCAMSIPVDYPNLFLIAPIGLAAFTRNIIFSKIKNKIKISVNFIKILSVISVIIPLGFFLWFNQMSYGNPFQFSGTVAGVRALDKNGNPAAPDSVNPQHIERFIKPDTQNKSAVHFFETRNILKGLNIHLISPDRGIIFFAPILMFSIFGGITFYKNKNKYLPVFLGIIGATLFLYSMWGDPWGGWAFGSRYMIPAYAILAIFIGMALTKFGKRLWFIIPFWLLFIYSVSVNTLGALTSSANPPKAESLALEKLSGKQERYSYDRNWEYLTSSKSKSFVFQTWGYKYLNSVQYYYILAGSIGLLVTILTFTIVLRRNEEEN